uniref:Uncharacterized protein n=1 Tax=Amphimedon queenslandica TaxID=400682 RepID=A0A1X7SPV1_AMPQE
LDTVNPGVRDLEFIIDEVPELQEIAIKLQGKYDSLALAVKKSLEIHCIDVEDAKFLIKECLRRKAHVVSGLMSFINILEKVIGFESLFDFLIKYDFIGYINYKLLKKLSELIKDDDEIIRLFFKYEEEYAKLLSAASFQDLIPLFHKQSDLSPTAPLGLPYVSFHLERPWLLTNVYTWISTFGQFSWSYYAFLKQLRENCVIITYAMLPCVLDDVIRDLTNPVILRKLKTEGVTVIELPQQEIESQLEYTTKKELISTLKQNEVVTIGKEVIIKSSSLGRELIRSIESHTKPEEVIGLLEAGADLNATE